LNLIPLISGAHLPWAGTVGRLPEPGKRQATGGRNAHAALRVVREPFEEERENKFPGYGELGEEIVSQIPGYGEPGEEQASQCPGYGEPREEQASQFPGYGEPGEEQASQFTGYSEPGEEQASQCPGHDHHFICLRMDSGPKALHSTKGIKLNTISDQRSKECITILNFT
jgi:hypothetical protein